MARPSNRADAGGKTQVFEEVALLDPKRLLKALNDDLRACQAAERFSSLDEDKQRCELEFIALRKHVIWAEWAGYDQSELGRIIRSLEENPLLSGYQRWRKRSEAVPEGK